MSLWELCYFRWQSKEVFWLNSNLHPLHLHGLIPRCLRSCCVLVQSVAKAASQYLHEKFLSPVCVVLCLSKCGFFLNAWPQMSHTFGFSSEWADLWWLRRRHFSTNCLWQSSHVNSPTSPCFSTWCCLTNIILAYLFPHVTSRIYFMGVSQMLLQIRNSTKLNTTFITFYQVNTELRIRLLGFMNLQFSCSIFFCLSILLWSSTLTPPKWIKFKASPRSRAAEASDSVKLK